MEWNVNPPKILFETNPKVTATTKLLGDTIVAEVTQLPEEIHILLIGGQLPHVGSVSIYDKGLRLDKIVLPGHKDDYVSDLWAQRISSMKNQKVTVACGIHYDNATTEMITEIQNCMSNMLTEVLLKVSSTQ